MQTLAQFDPRQLINAIGSQPRTTSLKVAEAFGKRHDNVLRAFATIDCSAEFNALNFEAVEYRDGKGEIRPAVGMTKDGFIFLVMGFTGAKAARVKEAYINAFNWMAEQLAGAAPAPQPAPAAALPEFATLHYGAHVLPVARVGADYWFGATVLARLLGFESANRITRRQDRAWLTRFEVDGRSLQMLARASVLDALRRAQPCRAAPFHDWLTDTLPALFANTLGRHKPAPAPALPAASPLPVTHAARALALDYFAQCRAAVAAAGGARPQWDHAAEERIADNMAGLLVANRHWVVAFGGDGAPCMTPVKPGAVLVDLSDSGRLIELLQTHVPAAALPLLMDAGLKRLAGYVKA